MNDLASLASLDATTRKGIDAACNFINHKISTERRRVTTVAAVAFGVAPAYWLWQRGDPRMPLMVALIVTMLVADHSRRGLRKWYKRMVVPRVIKAIAADLSYEQHSNLTKDNFNNLDLFEKRATTWRAEDRITGKRKNISFVIEEVKAGRYEQRGKRRREVIFFQGALVYLDFNKHFHGHTVVVAEKDSRSFGGLLGEAETRRGKNIVLFPNPDFERIYTVYATDDQEAHYLITPKLMELILRARSRLSSDLRLAFVNDSLFVAVPSTQDRFEVGLMSRVTPSSVAGDLAAVVQLTEQLIDLFDLETRIWSRV
jgi:hypothetical protein